MCILDRRIERSFFCKALEVTARSLEIFADLGLVEDAVDAGVWLTGVTVFSNGAIVHQMEIPSDLPLPYGALSLAQLHSGANFAVRSIAAHQPPAADLVPLAALRFNVSENAARILRKSVNAQPYCTVPPYRFNLSFEGGEYDQTFMLADLEVSWHLPRGPMYRFNRSGGDHGTGSLAAVPVPGSPRRYRLSTAMSGCADAATNDASEKRSRRALSKLRR